MSSNRQAFVLRIAPSRIDRVAAALQAHQIIIGWATAGELLDPSLDWEAFREILRRHYYAGEPNLRKAGSAAGNMWRFIREMEVGDLVVVPHGPLFYVAEVAGPATHDPSLIEDDTSFRREVSWLNDKQPIPREVARVALQARMKMQGTCASATDLVDEIDECLAHVRAGHKPSFKTDLHERLVREALEEIRSGRLNNFGFEHLLKTVLEGMGAEEVRIIPRALDKGADLIATFRVARAFSLTVAVQAKHFKPDPPVGVNVVEQLIRGIEAEAADYGMIVTSGNISEEAEEYAERYFEEKGVRIHLVDGVQLANMIVENGLAA